jgi:hypothetical protein
MREDLLYYIWKFKKFNNEALVTSEGEPLNIIHPGIQNTLSGPDFFNSKLQIGDQLWAGNVEMHLRSSDWYFHQHETDPNYDNVILHVVWEHDVEIYRKDNTLIPTLILKDRIEEDLLEAYDTLLNKEHLKINCEKDFGGFSEFQIQHWLERLYFERLEEKSRLILEVLSRTGNDWEATFFIMLCRSFGLNVNSDCFMGIAQSFDFKTLRKIRGSRISVEALLLGQAKLIRGVDKYGLQLEGEYNYLKHKYQLENDFLESPQFFRLRPDNFPTIRLAQIAALFSEKKDFFLKIVRAEKIEELYSLLDVEISDYWRSHYNFGKEHKSRNKKLTPSFLDLLLINCVIPLKHCYARYIGDQDEEAIQKLIIELKMEKNSVTYLFNGLRPQTATNAMESQGLLQLKNRYCLPNKCLECELGASLLRKSCKYH